MSFGEFFQGFGSLGDAFAEGQKKEALQTLGQQLKSGDYDGAADTAFKAGDVNTGLSVLKLGQGKAAGAQADNWLSQLYGNGGGGGGAAAGSDASSSGATPSMAGGRTSMTMPADPAVADRFAGALKAGGLTNPFGLAAMMGTAHAESGFSPANFTRSWSDPSQSGQAGTSGGALSWRDGGGSNRFTMMRNATAGADDPVVAQAKYALVENPNVTMALQNAKSAEEANAIMASSQRFAGWNDPGNKDFQNRLGLTRSYASRFASDGSPTGASPGLAGGGPPQPQPTAQSGLSPAPAPDAAPQASASASPPPTPDGSGLDAGVARRLALAAKYQPNTPVASIIGPELAQARPELLRDDDGSPMTAGRLVQKMAAGDQVAAAAPPLPPARPPGLGGTDVASADPNFVPSAGPTPQAAAASGLTPSQYLVARSQATSPPQADPTAGSGLTPDATRVAPPPVPGAPAASGLSPNATVAAQPAVPGTPAASGLTPAATVTAQPSPIAPQPVAAGAPGAVPAGPQPAPVRTAGPGAPPAAADDRPVVVPGFEDDGPYTRAQLAAKLKNPAADEDYPTMDQVVAAQKGAGGPAPTGSVSPEQVSAAAPAVMAKAGLPNGAVQAVAATTNPSARAMMLMRIMMIPGLDEGHQKVLGVLLNNELEQTKMPEDVKTYLFAKSVAGGSFTGTLADWKRKSDADTTDSKIYALYAKLEQAGGRVPMSFGDYLTNVKRAGATRIDNRVDTKAETAEAAEVGKARGGALSEYIKAGRGAHDKVQALDTMSDAIEAGGDNITTGPFAEGVLKAKQAWEGLTGQQVAGTSATEVLNKMNSFLASASARALTNRPAQQEFMNFMRNNPGIMTSLDGNKKLISILRQSAVQERELSDIAASSKNYADFVPKRDAYLAANPIISPFTNKPFGATPTPPSGGDTTGGGGTGGGGSGSPPPVAAPVRVQTPDQARGLQPGTRFQTPDGRTFIR